MKNEERLVEIMAELLAEVHEMRVENQKNLHNINDTLHGVDKKLFNLEKQQAKTNIGLADMRLALLKVADYHDRLTRLEKIVLK